jgi:hypothetical protein
MIFDATSRVAGSSVKFSSNFLHTVSNAMDICRIISGSKAWPARNGRIGMTALQTFVGGSAIRSLSQRRLGIVLSLMGEIYIILDPIHTEVPVSEWISILVRERVLTFLIRQMCNDLTKLPVLCQTSVDRTMGWTNGLKSELASN